MPIAERARPRDRKRRIEDAAALAFAERGYHQVSMSDVAAAVGISAPALYRHFPNKYALFVRTAFLVAHRLVEDTAADAEATPTTPAEAADVLGRLLGDVIATTMDLRAVGGLYRWEGRYLDPADRARLTAEFQTLRARFLAPHAVYRPDVPDAERETLVWAALAAVASITAHRTVVAAGTLRRLLTEAAWRAWDADIPPAAAVTPPVAPAPGMRRRERLIEEAIALFASRGYHDVTIEEIAAAADLTASGVYRHYEGKSSLLLEACDRAAARLEDGMRHARSVAQSPGEALRMLAADYVRYSVENRQLMRVYVADVGSLAPEEQRRLRALQRTYVSEWVELLRQARPELSAREATVLVHAGFSVVADLGLVAGVRHQGLSAATEHLVEVVLGI
ncbi:MAG: TetR/AcrR family transcriptional regulator [Microbacterium sp.]|uniref:TetR/AcrR family transcriptional regulator n=1 Tax=Microbacterium sp. TaxID=51671 RepID=UPI0026167B6A|nr:TetR/AcrR family transcriptional regulator [Microbacterium sp.]MCX6502591.1 TetR/AcrR family transcriptional regulator [Microbacterium sp.]